MTSRCFVTPGRAVRLSGEEPPPQRAPGSVSLETGASFQGSLQTRGCQPCSGSTTPSDHPHSRRLTVHHHSRPRRLIPPSRRHTSRNRPAPPNQDAKNHKQQPTRPSWAHAHQNQAPDHTYFNPATNRALILGLDQPSVADFLRRFTGRDPIRRLIVRTASGEEYPVIDYKAGKPQRYERGGHLTLVPSGYPKGLSSNSEPA